MIGVLFGTVGRRNSVNRAALVGLLAIVACNQGSEEAVESLPPYLEPVPEAIGVRAGAQGGDIGVSYQVEETYPAQQLLGEIQDRIGAEWSPRATSWLDPTASNALGSWTNYRDRSTTPESWVHQWSAEWTNSVGDVLSFDLIYRSQGPFEEIPEEPTTRLVEVFSGVTPAAQIAQFQEVIGGRQGKQRVASETGLTDAATDPGFLILRPVAEEPSEARQQSAQAGGSWYYFDEAEILLSSEHFLRGGAQVADGTSESDAGQPVVLIRLTDSGRERLKSWSKANIGRPIGLFLDGELRHAPRVRGILDGVVPFYAQSVHEAESIRARLNAVRDGG